MKKQLGWVGLILLLMGCSGQQQSQTETNKRDESEVITANVVYLPARNDAETQRGIELALDDINAKGWQIGGKSVRFVLQNIAEGNAEALQKAIAAKHPVGVLGYVDEARSALLQKNGLPAISLANEAGSADGANVFHIKATAVQQGGLIGQYLAVRQEMKSVAIVSHGAQTELTQALQNQLQTAGVRASMYILGQANQAEVKQLIAQLRAAKPELMFYSGDAKSAAMLVKKMQQRKLLVPVMLSEQVFGKSFIQNGGYYALGSMAVVAGLPLAQMSGTDAFISAYTQRYNSEATVQAAYGYDAALTLMSAMRLANSIDPQVYVSKLKSLNMADGLLSGALTFDDQGRRNEAVLTVYQVEEYGWQVADSIKANPNQTAQSLP